MIIVVKTLVKMKLVIKTLVIKTVVIIENRLNL